VKQINLSPRGWGVWWGVCPPPPSVMVRPGSPVQTCEASVFTCRALQAAPLVAVSPAPPQRTWMHVVIPPWRGGVPSHMMLVPRSVFVFSCRNYCVAELHVGPNNVVVFLLRVWSPPSPGEKDSTDRRCLGLCRSAPKPTATSRLV